MDSAGSLGQSVYQESMGKKKTDKKKKKKKGSRQPDREVLSPFWNPAPTNPSLHQPWKLGGECRARDPTLICCPSTSQTRPRRPAVELPGTTTPHRLKECTPPCRLTARHSIRDPVPLGALAVARRGAAAAAASCSRGEIKPGQAWDCISAVAQNAQSW